MNYADAITYLKENDIKKEDGTYYEFGEVSCSPASSDTLPPHNWCCIFHSLVVLQDIPEAPERQMTDKINKVES